LLAFPLRRRVTDLDRADVLLHISHALAQALAQACNLRRVPPGT
jgi:hypothetical protein